MDQFQHIDVLSAQALVEKGNARLVDIRDPQSFAVAHPPKAYHLTNETMVQFIDEVEFEQAILVMCYHGISSQGAAQYLINQGYEQVYSVDGGFEAWQRAQLPIESNCS
ncbi:thiosulfate sulfurtransferase GlpE [Vibrio sp. Of14-4]|uniref:thiosulfate sulfurtransferase GlpE n=1 Tax=Vibrio sp. Of14-4 TaxID=2724878 RepID=UPI001EF358A5|nr:thiosulfate sulfurtransferase GlpE [Vibrio sp. Of14-4]MCG7491451.1 thiosulfate sulfurtransferase GlpE [Vibrio sp. Of14-4]